MNQWNVAYFKASQNEFAGTHENRVNLPAQPVASCASSTRVRRFTQPKHTTARGLDKTRHVVRILLTTRPFYHAQIT
jgi:hypothetical protein